MSRRRSLAAWTRLGRELARLDPARHEELFRIAERIVEVHRDPVRAAQEAWITTPMWGPRGKVSA